MPLTLQYEFKSCLNMNWSPSVFKCQSYRYITINFFEFEYTIVPNMNTSHYDFESKPHWMLIACYWWHRYFNARSWGLWSHVCFDENCWNDDVTCEYRKNDHDIVKSLYMSNDASLDAFDFGYTTKNLTFTDSHIVFTR